MKKTQNIKRLKVVIFDWDNTLVESGTALIFCVNKVLEKYNLPEWEISKNKRDDRLSFRDNFPRIFGEDAEKAYQEYRKVYLQNVKNYISVFDGVYEIIDLFHKNNIPLVVMSNKDRLLLDFERDFLFKKGDFAKIVCGHEAKRDKPYADQLFYCLDGILNIEDINEESVWMIGDSPIDSDCAKASGVRAIRIGYPLWDCDNEDDDRISFFRNMHEFYEYIKKEHGEKWV